MSAVEVIDLSVRYGRSEALTDINLDLREGEVLAVLGMNGSGKSTLLRAMLGLIAPANGTVLHFGESATVEARRRMGAVFDEPAHWDRLTGWENAYFFSRSYGMSDADARERLDRLFSWAGLANKRDKAVGTYSYGMRRKLAIVEALAHRPDVLFMDEPTMGLDHVSLLALNQALRSMASEGGSVLATTNDLAEASAVADRICVLHQGRLMAIGAPGDLLAPLKKAMQVEVRLTRPIRIEALGAIGGVKEIAAGEGERTLHFYLRSDGESTEAVLGRIVARLGDSGGSVEHIAVKRPDLGYLLTELSRGGENALP